MRVISIVATIAALALAVTPAFAGKGGNGRGGGGGNTPAPNGSCTVSGNVVSGSGLPTDQVLNFMVTDSGGTWGWVLGYTDTGTWAVTVPARTGSTTYEFAGRTYGPSGAKYTVYASCNA